MYKQVLASWPNAPGKVCVDRSDLPRNIQVPVTQEEKMDEPGSWRHMRTAPRDGSRILVTIRASEQGPGVVDLAYWSSGDQFGGEAWRSSDSAPGRIIEYAETELQCWMPMPTANFDRLILPNPWEGEDANELDGSGI
jgi:hypothetical protein